MKNYDAGYLQKLQGFFGELKEKSYELLQLSPTDIVADIGCGLGEDARQMAKKAAWVYGIDSDAAFIDEATVNAASVDNLSFLVADACNTGLASGSMDKVRYERIFQHAPDHDGLLNEAHRLLKPGGLLQIVDSDYLSWSIFLNDNVLERKIIDSLAYSRFKGGHLLRKLPERFNKAGFDYHHFEVRNFLVNDFNFANFIIDFNTVFSQEHQKGNITGAEYEAWANADKTKFCLSMNLIIVMGIKVTS